MLEEVVEHLARRRVLLALDDDAHAVTVRLVAHVGDAVDLAALDEVGDLLQQGRLVDLVGDGRGHDGGAAAARLLEGHLGLHHDTATPVGVHVADGVDLLPLPGHRIAPAVVAEDHAARGQVGTEEVLAELGGGEVRIVDERLRGAHDLAQVVWRDVGGHAHGDAGRAVDEQVGQLRRQDGRLHARAVVVLDEVDGVLVDVGQDLGGDGRHARLGVAHGRRRVAVHGAEVALSIDEREAQREVLRKAHQGVVDGLVAVGMVLAHDVADDGGALAIGGRGGEAHLAHRVEDAAVHGLQAVADVRQRAADDDAHGVVEVRRLELLLDGDRADVLDWVGHARLLVVRSPWRAAASWASMSAANPAERVAAREVDGALTVTPQAGQPGAQLGRASSGGWWASESRMTQARAPSAVAHGRWPSPPRGRPPRPRVEARPVADGPGERLLDHLLGIAHEHATRSPSSAAQPIPAALPLRAAGTRCGQGGQRGPHEPPFERPRRVDELLELRPAERLCEDGHGPHLGEAVDLDPVLSARCHATQELPGSLRVIRQ